MVNFLSDCVCVCGQSLLQDPGLRRRLLLAISHGGLRPGLDRGAPLDQRNAHQSAVLRRPRNAGSVHVNHRFSFVFCFVWFCFCFFTEKCPNAGASCWAFTSFFFFVFVFFLTNQQGHSAGGRRHRRIQRQRARHPARNDGLHRVHARSLSAAGKKKETKPNQTNPHRPLRRSRRSVSSKSRGVGVPPSERSGRSMTALNSVLCCCCCCCCSFLLIRPNGRLANQFGGPPVRLIYCGTEADLFSFFFFHFSCCCRFLLKWSGPDGTRCRIDFNLDRIPDNPIR